MAQTVAAPAPPAARLRKVLSYTEAKALRLILEQMRGMEEATLVTSALADAAGLTRSVAVAALAKAEAAGVVETWNLGRLGTRIRILDRQALEEAVRA